MAVALLSGGLDSGTALLMWHANHPVRLALFADYGQRAARAEARASRALAERFEVEWQRIELSWLRDVSATSGSALVDGGGEVPDRTAGDPGDPDSAAAVWVPARNVVLLAAAAAYADALGAGVVIAGFNREEAATFPDNSGEFVDAINAALAFGTAAGVRVESPTAALDKAAIAAVARDHGLGPGDFWSCYRGGAEPCGRCESCVRSRRAWDA